MVREAIARHGGVARRSPRAGDVRAGDPCARTRATRCCRSCAAATATALLIEPAVRCNHCGYCKSLRPLSVQRSHCASLPVDRWPCQILVTRKLPSSVLARLEAVGDVDVYTRRRRHAADELRAARRRQGRARLHADRAVDRAVIDAGPAAEGRSPTSPSATTTSTWPPRAARHRRHQHARRADRRGRRFHVGADSGDHAPAVGRRAAGPPRRLEGLGVRLHARHRAARASSSAWSGSAASAAPSRRRAPAFGMRVAYTSRRDAELPGRRAHVARSAAEHVRRRVAARAADAGDAAPDRSARRSRG